MRWLGSKLNPNSGRLSKELTPPAGLLVVTPVVLDAVGDVLLLTGEAEAGWARAPVGTYAAMLREAQPGRVLLGAAYRPPGFNGPLLLAVSVDEKASLERLEAGATLIQGYTGFLYRGPGWARQILRGLARASARPTS